MRVAFLGLGKMGRLMAGHLISAGHELVVWNRSDGPADALVQDGAIKAASPAQAAEGVEIVFSMLFGPDSVRAVLLDGPDAAVNGAERGTLFVDASTIGPEHAREIGTALADGGMRFVDAPVAGSTPVAAKGELGVLCGGDDADIAFARPLLETWGAPEKVLGLGPVGAGQAAKLVINASLGVTITGIGECLRLADALGVGEAQALDVLALGPFGWMLAGKRPMIVADDFSAVTFAVDAMTKDLNLALDAAGGAGSIPVIATAAEHGEALLQAERGSEDFAAIAAEARNS